MSSFSGRLCLVTGGAGFIGSHLVNALLEQGASVRVLDDLSTGKPVNIERLGSSVEFFQGSLNDLILVRAAVQGVETIFHQAALASVPLSVESPLSTHAACATGTINLLDAARKAGVRRFVYAASSSAYGDSPASSKRESDLPAPISPYGAAKLVGELYCQAFAASYSLETVALRYFNVFGPGQDPNSQYSAVIPKFITMMLAGRRPVIFGDGKQSRDFTFVRNVVDGNLLAATAPDVSGRVFNLATGRSVTLLELVAVLNRALGTNIAPELAPARTGDIVDSLADISLARRYLGYEPRVDFEEGMRRSIGYYRDLAGK